MNPLPRDGSVLRALVPAALLLLFVCAILYKLVFLRESLFWGDIYLYFYPQQHLIAESLRNGQLPLWNPFVLCGQPLVGNPQVWLFYPTTALLLWMPVWAYFTVNTVLHLFLAALGTFLYLRRTTGDRLAALLGATAFAGSGVLVARLQFPSMIQAAAYLPWMLLLVDRMVDRQRFWYIGLFGAITSLGLLAAHTQVTYIAFLCTGAYGLARLVQIHASGGQVFRVLGGMAAGAVLGVVAACVQWLPALELLRHSTRQALTLAQSNRFVFGPENLIGFVFPYYHGNPAEGSYWGRGNFWEPCVYLGIPAVVLAVYGLASGRTRPMVRFWGLVAAASTLLAMGTMGGLFVLAFFLLPGMKSFHDPARFMILTVFALASLAGIGMRLLRDRGVSERYRLGIFALSILSLWWFAAHANPTLDPSAYRYRPRVLAIVPRLAQGRVLTAQRERVWERYLNYDDYGPDSARYAHELADTLAPNIGSRFGLEEASGYEPVPVRASTELDGLARQAISRRSPHLPELLTLLNVHLVLFPLGTPYSHPSLVAAKGRGASVFRMAHPSPRAWVVAQTVRVDSRWETLEALASPEFRAKEVALVGSSGGRNQRSKAASEPCDAVGTQFGPNGLRISVQNSRAGAFLVVSQAWYPGWVARANGRRVRVVKANHSFTGVYLERGTNVVTLRYEPQVVRVALFVSVVGVAAVSAILSAGVALRPYSRNREPALPLPRGGTGG